MDPGSLLRFARDDETFCGARDDEPCRDASPFLIITRQAVECGEVRTASIDDYFFTTHCVVPNGMETTCW